MKYQLLPALTAEEYAALEASIVEHGVLVPVEYDENGEILDGHHRVAICESLGLVDWPRFVRKGLTEAEKRAHIRALNMARRHLTAFQKRAIIEAQVKEMPWLSNRALAAMLGVDNKTIHNRRREMEASGSLARRSTITGRNGVRQPARKPSLPECPLLSDGVRLDSVSYYDLCRRIRECEADLALLRAVRDRAVPCDDRALVRDIIPASFLKRISGGA